MVAGDTSRSDEPREYDLDTFSAHLPEEFIASLQELRVKFDEVQSYCDSVVRQREIAERAALNRERELLDQISSLEEEVLSLKQANVQLTQSKSTKIGHDTPPWLKTCFDTLKNEQTIRELQNQVSRLKLTVKEKDSSISSLQWKLKDLETSNVALTAERQQLAYELDELEVRLEDYERYMEAVEEHIQQGSMRMLPESGSWRDVNINPNRDDPEGNRDGQQRLKRSTNFSNIHEMCDEASFQLDLLCVSAQGSPHSTQVRNGSLSSLYSLLPSPCSADKNRTVSHQDISLNRTLGGYTMTSSYTALNTGVVGHPTASQRSKKSVSVDSVLPCFRVKLDSTPRQQDCVLLKRYRDPHTGILDGNRRSARSKSIHGPSLDASGDPAINKRYSMNKVGKLKGRGI